jgi:S-adenosylmethionine decarboxylase proenzyme
MKISTGKHMIADLHNVRNTERLESLDSIRLLFDRICDKHDFHILGKMEHRFEPQGITMIYMLSESHISIHTFPEKGYFALDIYTCREYSDNSIYLNMYQDIVRWFDCDYGKGPTIVNRGLESSVCNQLTYS